VRLSNGHKLGRLYTIKDMGYKTPCWMWECNINSHGYPKIWNGRTYIAAHRYMYRKYKGEIPANLQIDHLCRIRACVNPEHLEAVTQSVNQKRRYQV
jgi:hypothetical protein